MKKLLAICLTLVLVATMTVPVFAYDGTGESQITAHIYSHYNITIPATINADMGNGQVTITDASLEDGYKVDVFVVNADGNGAIVLTHENGTNTIECSFNNLALNRPAGDGVPLVSFLPNEISTEGNATKEFGISVMHYGKAGNYTGTMQYAFSCNPVE